MQQVEMLEIVVAAHDLEIGAAIEAPSLKIEQWPSNKIPEEAFEAIEDTCRPGYDLPNFDQRARLRVGGWLRSAPASVSHRKCLTACERWPCVSTMSTASPALYCPRRESTCCSPVRRLDVGDVGRLTKTILSHVRVLSAGEHLAPDASGRPQRVPVVTLLLSPEQAELLTLARAEGQIQLVLRNSMDEDATKTAGVREPELFSIDFKPATKPRSGRPVAPRVIRVQAPPRPVPGRGGFSRESEVGAVVRLDRAAVTFREYRVIFCECQRNRGLRACHPGRFGGRREK